MAKKAQRKTKKDPAGQGQRQWLLLIYKVPQDPPGRRTYVWRQLKQLGAVYLQQAAGVLPERPEVRAALEALAGRIREFAGEVSLLETTSPDPVWERDLVARFNQARGDEYAELIKNVARLEDEMGRETTLGKFSFVELEDLEAESEKLQKWCERITARDFFAASDRVAALQALARAQTGLANFAAAVYQAEGIQGEGRALPAPNGVAHHTG